MAEDVRGWQPEPGRPSRWPQWIQSPSQAPPTALHQVHTSRKADPAQPAATAPGAPWAVEPQCSPPVPLAEPCLPRRRRSGPSETARGDVAEPRTDGPCWRSACSGPSEAAAWRRRPLRSSRSDFGRARGETKPRPPHPLLTSSSDHGSVPPLPFVRARPSAC